VKKRILKQTEGGKGKGRKGRGVGRGGKRSSNHSESWQAFRAITGGFDRKRRPKVEKKRAIAPIVGKEGRRREIKSRDSTD